MLPHHEDYELCPKNGHVEARKILKEDFFWDCTDSEGPLGNDNGADIFCFYGKALESNSFIDAKSFLNGILHEWEFEFSEWEAGREEGAALYDADTYAFEAANDGAIALAFSMIVVNGEASTDSIDLASHAIQRELNPDVLARRWRFAESRKKKLEVMLNVLDNIRKNL